MANLEFRPSPPLSSYRRIAAVAWDAPTDPHVYGSMEVRSEAVEAWITRKRAETGARITLTHAVARALAIVLHRHPELNAFVRWGSLAMRKNIDIFVQVVVEDAENIGNTDLSGVKIQRADTMDVVAMCAYLSERAAKIRNHQDADFEQTKSTLQRIPGVLLAPLLKFIAFLQYSLNISPRFIGAPPDPFGSAMVTNVGVFGLTRAWAPFFPPARSSLIITLGAIEEKAVVEDGKLAIGRVLHVNGTFDHRIIDGYHAGVVAREMRALLERPESLDEPLG
jgi:pyruvate/2-oxoglutarate dehydrogenase complex dihydrolipoamide acyltransferase (E2) component